MINQRRVKRGLLGAVLGISLAFPSLHVSASGFLLSDSTITVSAGQTFSLPVSVDPYEEGQYTVRLVAQFSPEVLEVADFSFASSWLALSQPGYDLVDNTNGQLVKTAGYPQGFTVAQTFGTITFRAKQAGETTIAVGAQSFILNAENTDTLHSRPQALVRITEAESVAPAPTASSDRTVETSIEGETVPELMEEKQDLSGVDVVSAERLDARLPWWTLIVSFVAGALCAFVSTAWAIRRRYLKRRN